MERSDSPPRATPPETPPPDRRRRASAFAEAWRLIENAARRFGEHELTDRAAALTYYSVLSVFPLLIVIVGALGLFGESTVASVTDNMRELAPNAARDTLVSAIDGVRRSQTTAGAAFAFGLVAVLYSASAYVGAFIRSANAVWGVREQRRFWQTIPLRVAITLLMVVLITAIGGSVVLTGPLASELRSAVGLGAGRTLGWDLFKWPVLAVLATLLLAVLYNLAPNVDRRFRVATAGSVFAVTLWLLSSAVFSIYVANFGSYNKTYGSLAGLVIFFIWIWLTNVAILLGVELDSELTRYRRVHGRSPFRSRRPRR